MRAKKISKHRLLFICLGLLLLLAAAACLAVLEWRGNTNVLESVGVTEVKPPIGTEIDNFNGVAVYYNGPIDNVSGRSVASDGYNLGQQYQCVEFVKRYYYEFMGHKMPDPWGHAKSFYDPSITDGGFNKARGLKQYANGGGTKPEVNDILVFGSTGYGHVAIICEVGPGYVEMIQQNPGPYAPSRERLPLTSKTVSYEDDGRMLSHTAWKIGGRGPSGWLRK